MINSVLAIRQLTDSAYVVRLERNELRFQTGQFVVLKDPASGKKREYSVYSGMHDDYLEVLVREVRSGKVSRKLKKLKAGDVVEVEGPFGFFRLNPEVCGESIPVFLATGTGISPFHSFVRSYPEAEYRLLHGIRYREEAYDLSDYDRSRLTLCTSGEPLGDFFGRLTEYLGNCIFPAGSHYFLCGSNQMISDVFDILTGKGVPVSRIHAEVYF
jgi:ferredoxin/flavodoxin---NADP+ reductase